MQEENKLNDFTKDNQGHLRKYYCLIFTKKAPKQNTLKT